MPNFVSLHTNHQQHGIPRVERERDREHNSIKVTMSDIATSCNEWVQFCEQSVSGHSTYSSFIPSDPTIVATNCGLDSISPTNPSVASGQSNPTDGDRIQKPIRKRSRASKKTPATVLNADPANFRALVQQFTGCQSGPISSGGQKGPVNLNFQLGKMQDHRDVSTITASSGGSYCCYQHQTISQMDRQPRQVQLYLQHPQQEQRSIASVPLSQVGVPTSSSSDACFPAFGDSTAHGLEMPADGFFVDDFPLHELSGESFPGKVVNENFF